MLHVFSRKVEGGIIYLILYIFYLFDFFLRGGGQKVIVYIFVCVYAQTNFVFVNLHVSKLSYSVKVVTTLVHMEFQPKPFFL